jgi:phosphotransferase system enzyme I (PtsI)
MKNILRRRENSSEYCAPPTAAGKTGTNPAREVQGNHPDRSLPESPMVWHSICLQSLLSFPREVGDDMNLSVRFHATVLAPGFALGNAFFIRERPLPPSGEPSDLPDALRELHMFKQSVVRAVEELESLIEQLERGRSPEPADIARAHLAMLSDSGFHEDIQRKIATQGLQAERAVEEVIHELVILFERSENEVLAERSADLKDLELRLKAALGGQPHDVFRSIASADNHIALVDELLPSYVFDAHTHHVSGFLVTKGTPLAHAVILARHYGMPVLKMEHLSRIENGTALLLDGANGYVVMEPDEAMIRDVLPARQPSHVPETHESLPAALWLSIIDPQQLDAGVLADAAGIGLYRTEMLFMKHSHDFPAEDEQYRVYRSLFEKCGGKPVTIRTLDIGGDKLLPYFSLGPQANPYMGFRAHRIWRFHPEILVCQIRAIMRAAGHEGRLRILYPMIETVDSLAFVQELVRDAVASLRRQGEPIPDRYEEGLLIEVPSAVWDYSALLARVDYASLGTNDLLQYFFAADRNNPNISSFYVPEHPAVIRMLHWIVDKNAQANKPLNICGEIAADRAYLPLLVGLGIRDLSIAPGLLAEVRAVLSGLEPTACSRLARNAMEAGSAAEVRQLLRDFGGLQSEFAMSDLPGESEMVDPICRMVVEASHQTLSVTDNGKTTYFCSPQCRRQFLAQTSGVATKSQ